MNRRGLYAILLSLAASVANAQGMLEPVWSVDTAPGSVEISSDGAFVLHSYREETGYRFVTRDMNTGEVTGQIVVEDGWHALNPSLSADGRFVVSYFDNGQTWATRVYRLSDGALLRHIPFAVRGRLSPDGEYVYYAEFEFPYRLRKMRVSDGSIIWSVVIGYSGWEWDTAVTPDGSRVAGVAFVDNQFEMMTEFDAEDGTQVNQFPIAGGGNAAWRSLQYTHEGTRIAFARYDGPYGGTGLLYDVAQGDLLASLSHPSVLSMQFDAQSRQVATAGLDGWLRIWDGSSLSLLGVFNSLIAFSSDISDDGRFIVLEGQEVEGSPWLVKLVRNPLSSIIGTPESAVVKRGRTISGDVGSLSDNDSQRLLVKPEGEFDPSQPAIQVVVEATVPEGSVQSLRLLVDGGASADVEQTIELYDFVAQTYLVVDVRPATVPDLLVVADAGGEPANFVEAGTGKVRARIGYRETVLHEAKAFITGNPVNGAWARLDYLSWRIDR